MYRGTKIIIAALIVLSVSAAAFIITADQNKQGKQLTVADKLALSQEAHAVDADALELQVAMAQFQQAMEQRKTKHTQMLDAYNAHSKEVLKKNGWPEHCVLDGKQEVSCTSTKKQ